MSLGKGRYVCGWCGHQGVRVWEQLAEMLVEIESTLERTFRYVCFNCGMEVKAEWQKR